MSPIRTTSALALSALVLAIGTACSNGADTDTFAGKATSSGAAGTADPAMEHVHGIGVDPADGAVYAGTHLGLFRIEKGLATRVADLEQDFMGFTVVGPGRFLASGHPGAGQGGPGAVGLIETKDSGRSWQPLSLSGEADFHALEYRHGRAYGLDSMTGQLQVSTDLRGWRGVSSEPIADFAVSPSDPQVLLATMEKGPGLSTDGGRTFATLGSAPVLIFVGWAEDGTLAGVTPDGIVFTAPEPDGEWTERGALDGPPEAFTVHSAEAIYAAAGGSVLLSTDGARTFTPLLGE